MKIGILSDTHGYLDPTIFDHFEDCAEVWHAGDFGNMEVVDQLREFKPLRGVFGNIDDGPIRHAFGCDERFQCEKSTVWMTHIGGKPGRYDPRVRNVLASDPPRMFLCGHSHILHIQQDKRHGGMIYLNPGAAGHHGFHVMRTVVTLEFHRDQIGNLNVIELGPRGRRNNHKTPQNGSTN